MKNNEMWIIKQGRRFFPWSVKSTRKDCITNFCKNYCRTELKVKDEWKNRQALGNYCVKIRVEEI